MFLDGRHFHEKRLHSQIDSHCGVRMRRLSALGMVWYQLWYHATYPCICGACSHPKKIIFLFHSKRSTKLCMTTLHPISQNTNAICCTIDSLEALESYFPLDASEIHPDACPTITPSLEVGPSLRRRSLCRQSLPHKHSNTKSWLIRPTTPSWGLLDPPWS